VKRSKEAKAVEKHGEQQYQNGASLVSVSGRKYSEIQNVR
jgi:hypothetical protein